MSPRLMQASYWPLRHLVFEYISKLQKVMDKSSLSLCKSKYVLHSLLQADSTVRIAAPEPA